MTLIPAPTAVLNTSGPPAATVTDWRAPDGDTTTWRHKRTRRERAVNATSRAGHAGARALTLKVPADMPHTVSHRTPGKAGATQ